MAGEIFKELALAVTFALLASPVVSLTVVPMIASRLLRPVHRSAAENTGAEPQRPKLERRPLAELEPPSTAAPSGGVQLTGDEALLLVNLLRKRTNTLGSTGASPSAGSQESEPA